MSASGSPSVQVPRSPADGLRKTSSSRKTGDHSPSSASPSVSSRPSTGASPRVTTPKNARPSPIHIDPRINPLANVINGDHEQTDLTSPASPGFSSVAQTPNSLAFPQSPITSTIAATPTASEYTESGRGRNIVHIPKARDARFGPTVGVISRAAPPSRRGSDASQRTFASGTTDNRRSSIGGSPPPDAKRKRTTIKSKTGTWELGKTIGAGSMGKVKLARHADTHEQVAVKIVPRQSTEDHKTPEDQARADKSKEVRTAREAAIVTLLDHPYVCGMRDVVRTQQHWYMFFEYVNGGQMLDYIISHGRLKEKQARKFARQIASALDYCHRNSLVHRDLKIENILISKTGDIKIIDFGLSNTFSPNTHLKTFCGSLYFAAPELLQAKEYTGPEVDIWSFGIVLYVLVCGKVPFDDQSMQNLHAKIKKGHVDYPPWLGSDCRSLISRMLVVDPAQRATMIEIINHPWMVKTCGGPPDNYLPIRKPLTTPLDRNVIRKMDGFDFGTAGELEKRLYKTVDSDEYKRTTRNIESRAYSVTSPNPEAHKRGVLEFYKRRSSNSASKDTLPTPSSSETVLNTINFDTTLPFSPLISVYYLAREKLEREQVAKEIAAREAADKEEKDREAREIRAHRLSIEKEISGRKERQMRAQQEKVAAEQRIKAKKEAAEKAAKEEKEKGSREAKEAKEARIREAKEAKEKAAREAEELKAKQHREVREAKEKRLLEEKALESERKQAERLQRLADEKLKKEQEKEKKELEKAQKEFEREQKESAQREKKELEREKKEYARAQKEVEREQKEALERDRKERQEQARQEKGGASPLSLPFLSIFGDRSPQSTGVTAPVAAHTNSEAYELEGETTGGRTRPRSKTQGDEPSTEYTPTKLQSAAGAAAGLLRRISTRRRRDPRSVDETPSSALAPHSSPSLEVTSPVEQAEDIEEAEMTEQSRGEAKSAEPLGGRLKKSFSLRRRPATAIEPTSAVEVEVTSPEEQPEDKETTIPITAKIKRGLSLRRRPATAVSPADASRSPSLLDPNRPVGSSGGFLSVGLGRSFSVNSSDFRNPQIRRRGGSEDSGRPAAPQLGLQTDNKQLQQLANGDATEDPRSAPAENMSRTNLARQQSVRNGRLQKRRPETRPSAASSAIQPQEDLHDNDQSSAGGVSSLSTVKPVYLKGLFSVSTTSNKPLEVIEADILRVLDSLGIRHISNGRSFLCTYMKTPQIPQRDENTVPPLSPIRSPSSSLRPRRKTSFGQYITGDDGERRHIGPAARQVLAERVAESSQSPSGRGKPPSNRSYDVSDGSNLEINEAPLSSPLASSFRQAGGETSTHIQADMNNTSMVLRFEIFIVKVPLFQLHGIRFQKTAGNTWQYKEMAQKILQDLKL